MVVAFLIGKFAHEVMTMFLAGHETTARLTRLDVAALGPTSGHSGAGLVREAQSVLADGQPSAADVSKLVFCEQVIREIDAALSSGLSHWPPAAGRLYDRRPPPPRRHQRPHEPMDRAARSALVRRAAAIHPDRWSDGLASRLPKYAYFPFGGASRLYR